MKNQAFLLFICLFISSCSRNLVFEDSLIKLYYSNEYEEAQISNAPHMLVKLESEDAYFSISYWDYELSEDVDAWDDFIYEQYKEGVSDNNLILYERTIVNLKNEEIRAIKIFSNITNERDGIGCVSFIFIKNGALYLATYIQQVILTQNSSSQCIEDVLNGLVLKNKSCAVEEKETSISIDEFENYMLNMFKKTNETLPMKTDEATTLFNVSCVGKTIMFKYRVEPFMVGYMNAEWALNFKEKTILNMILSVPESDVFASYFSRSSINIVYVFFDEEDNLIQTLKITPKDFE